MKDLSKEELLAIIAAQQEEIKRKDDEYNRRISKIERDFAELQEKYKNYLAATLKVKCPSVEMACCGSSISIMFWFFEKEMKV